jgi:hypothetical protein
VFSVEKYCLSCDMFSKVGFCLNWSVATRVTLQSVIPKSLPAIAHDMFQQPEFAAAE